MARSVEVKRTTRGALSGDEAERLFATVDETGHTTEERAKKRGRRPDAGEATTYDPLAGEDPSGANTDRLITRSAIIFVMVFLVLVMLLQVGWGYVRRVTTSTLAEDASMQSVVSALNMGVEWGGGFTQFPSEFTVQEADENTHRIEVTVTDSGSSSELDAFATAQVQASALSVNALLNPNIDTVVYHVKVRRDDAGRFQRDRFFGYLHPTGATTPFMTFVWTKTTSEEGVRFDCAITGMDNRTQENLHKTITSKSTPATIINYVIGESDAEVAKRVMSAAQDEEATATGVDELLEAMSENEVDSETQDADASGQADEAGQADDQAEDAADAPTDETSEAQE